MGRSKTKVLVDSLSSEGPLSALWSAAFSLYPLVVEVGVRLCMSLLTWTLLVSGPQPYDSFLTLITSLYALSPNTVILGVKTGYSENQFIMWVVGWGGFSHNTNNSWTSAGCPTIQLRSTQFWHYLPRESIQSHGLSVQFCDTVSPTATSDASHKALCFWPPGYRLEVLKTPCLDLWPTGCNQRFPGLPLRFSWFAGTVQRIRRNILLTKSLVYCKRM